MTNRELAYIVKNQSPLVLPSEGTVQQACTSMRDRGTGSVLIVDSNARLIGILTGRDAVRFLSNENQAAATRLTQAMTCNPVSITPKSCAIDALRAMSDGAFRLQKTVRSLALSRAAISRAWNLKRFSGRPLALHLVQGTTAT